MCRYLKKADGFVMSIFLKGLEVRISGVIPRASQNNLAAPVALGAGELSIIKWSKCSRYSFSA